MAVMPTRHVLIAVLVAVTWGVNFVVIHVGLDAFPPLLFVALRFTLVAFPAVFFVGRPGVGVKWVLLVGTFMSMGQFAFVFTSIDQGLPAGLASLVLQLQAVFTVLLAVALLGERLRPGQVIGGLVAFVGIGVIGAGRDGDVPLLALGLCVAGALSWGIGNVANKRARPDKPLALLVWSSLVPPIPLTLMSIATEDPGSATLDASGALALLYVVVLSTFFGFGAWTWLLRRHPASTVAPFTLLVPPVGILSAWVALGERPNAAELAGGAIVLAGLAVTTRASAARPVAQLVTEPQGSLA